MTAKTSDIRSALSAEFNGEVLQFRGRGGKVFDYIEDETVMDRLDDVLGIGAVSFEFTPVTDTCVKGRMTIRWQDGTTGSVYEDFGYPTQPDSAEPYKEAVSDCIRRLGRYVGVARYLYRKHESVGAQNAPQRPAPAPVAPRPTPRPVAVPDDPFPPSLAEIDAAPANECPDHHKPYRSGAKGLYCATKLPDGSWCLQPRIGAMTR